MKTLSFVVMFACAALAAAKQALIMRDCARSNTAAFKITSANVSPYPVAIPGSLTVLGSLRVNRAFSEIPLHMDVSIKRHVGFVWVPVPCIKGVGSCTYDFCKLLAAYKNGCPPELVKNNLPCTCDTIVPGDYSINNQEFTIPNLSGLWSWLASGDYKLEIVFRDTSTNTEAGCLHIELTIVDGNSCSGFMCNVFG